MISPAFAINVIKSTCLREEWSSLIQELLPYNDATEYTNNSQAKSILKNNFQNYPRLRPNAIIAVCLLYFVDPEYLKSMGTAVACAWCAVLGIVPPKYARAKDLRVIIYKTLCAWLDPVGGHNFRCTLKDAAADALLPYPAVFAPGRLPNLFGTTVKCDLKDILHLLRWYKRGADKVEEHVLWTLLSSTRAERERRESIISAIHKGCILDQEEVVAATKKLLQRTNGSKKMKDSAGRDFNSEAVGRAWANLPTFLIADIPASSPFILDDINAVFCIDIYGGVISRFASSRAPTGYAKDHTFPYALGGLSLDGNLTILHHRCNAAKSDAISQFVDPASLHPDNKDWFDKKGFLDALGRYGPFALLGRTPTSMDSTVPTDSIHGLFKAHASFIEGQRNDAAKTVGNSGDVKLYSQPSSGVQIHGITTRSNSVTDTRAAASGEADRAAAEAGLRNANKVQHKKRITV